MSQEALVERLTDDELAAIKAAHELAEAARPLIGEDYPVGAAPRAQWARARSQLADAAGALLAHISALSKEVEEAREARDAFAQALLDASENVHHCGERYMTNPPMCVRAHNARMAVQRIVLKYDLSPATHGQEETKP